MSDRRPLIVIQSGDSKFLGLTLPEWTIALFPIVAIGAFIPFEVYRLIVAVYMLVLMLYAQIFSKFEENVLKLYQNNRKLPNIVKGYYCNTLPIIDMKEGDIFDN